MNDDSTGDYFEERELGDDDGDDEPVDAQADDEGYVFPEFGSIEDEEREGRRRGYEP